MPNAAHELAEMLDSWRTVVDGQSVFMSRGDKSNSGNTSFWIEQLNAASLMSQVVRDLNAIEASGQSVAHYRRMIPAWSVGIFTPTRNWESGGPFEIVDQLSVDMLRAFGDYAGSILLTSRVDPPRKEAAINSIDEIIEFLTSEEIGLGLAHKRYVFELLSSIRDVLNSSSFATDADFVRRIHELYGFLTLLADELAGDPSTADAGEALRKKARRVVPWAMFAAKAGSALLGGAADLDQLMP